MKSQGARNGAKQAVSSSIYSPSPAANTGYGDGDTVSHLMNGVTLQQDF
jgi:hypothetical protein